MNLRAERSGKRSGRVYTIAVQCNDGSENIATKTMTVTVPNDQGKRKFKKFKSIWKKYHRLKFKAHRDDEDDKDDDNDKHRDNDKDDDDD